MSDIATIEYGEPTTVSRWFREYWTERDLKFLPWLFVALLIGFLILGPRMLLLIVSYLPVDELGNSGASISAHLLLQLVATLLGASALTWVSYRLARPSRLELSDLGITKIWQLFGLIPMRGSLVAWDNMSAIAIERDKGKFDSSALTLAIKTNNQTPDLKLRNGDLVSDEGRKQLADFISTKALKASIEADVFDVLSPQKSLSFTEIWLEALAARPNRERLVPISDGTILDNRYTIQKKLGEGGQGSAYLAQDSETQSSVVLKETILPVYADIITRKQALEAFHKEAFALESVKSPNIVKFKGSFVADHRAYLVLEYLPGETLAQKIKRNGHLSNAEARNFALQMCDILNVLHTASPPMVHRDFTPDNLIITGDDKLTLIDFAVSVNDEIDSDVISGKPSYMAPEQLQGKPTTLSDLYSLGCTMHYMLTGDQPAPLCECWPNLENAEVSDKLNEIVKRCTKQKAEQRFSTAREIEAALKDA